MPNNNSTNYDSNGTYNITTNTTGMDDIENSPINLINTVSQLSRDNLIIPISPSVLNELTTPNITEEEGMDTPNYIFESGHTGRFIMRRLENFNRYHERHHDYEIIIRKEITTQTYNIEIRVFSEPNRVSYSTLTYPQMQDNPQSSIYSIRQIARRECENNGMDMTIENEQVYYEDYRNRVEPTIETDSVNIRPRRRRRRQMPIPQEMPAEGHHEIWTKRNYFDNVEKPSIRQIYCDGHKWRDIPLPGNYTEDNMILKRRRCKKCGLKRWRKIKKRNSPLLI